MSVERSKESFWNEEIANEIIDRMQTGETLKSICKSDHIPNYSIVLNWQHGRFGAPKSWTDDYARARRSQADGFAADIIELADGASQQAEDYAEQELAKLGDEASERDRRRVEFFAKKRSIEERKLMIDVRKWTAGRMSPSKWGDRVTLEHASSGDAPIRLDLTGLSLEQLESIAALEGKIADTQSGDGEK